MKIENQTSNGKVFTITRTFDAPQQAVFNAFADADALNEWWGPAAMTNTVISLDFRPGGIFHYRMESNGQVSYGRFLFSKIQPYDLLEFTNAFSDAQANVVPAPFDMQLPAEIFYRFLFAEQDGKTRLTMTGEAVNCNQAEEEGFQAISDSMHEGFGATFDQLTNYLKK